MKPRIQSCSDNRELRALLIDAAEQLAGGECQLLEPRLPWDGHPILLADAQAHPVLVSFDPSSGDTALLDGLKAVERLTAALPWVNQVYDALQNQQHPARLVLVSREPPSGAGTILTQCADLSLFRYAILDINGDSGLWLEPVCAAAARQPETTAKPLQAADPPIVESLPSLSDEETSYFQQL